MQKNKPTIRQVKRMARTPLFVILDNIRSIHNVGAIFRTSDAILAEKLFLCGITGHPPRKDLDKAALGAVDVVPWEYKTSSAEVVQELKKAGVSICALEQTDQSVPYKKADYQFPMALIVGNEVDGIHEELLPFIDMAVDIPMLGRANSLNVATAYGIVGYEILDQYTAKVLQRRV